MIEQRVADVHGNEVVRFLANQPDNTIRIHLHIVHIFQMPDSGQHHHDAVRNKPHASDYTLHPVVHFVTAFFIHPAKVFDELFLQNRGKRINTYNQREMKG